MSDHNSGKAMQLPMFDGREESFQKWWTKFRAYAVAQGFVKCLQEKAEKDLPSEEDEELDHNSETDKRKIEAMHRNQLAVANLTIGA